jgi:nucleotide-binding universal stress UspA family protein
MYQKIMVPLDGSELAECALPHAIHIAKASKARIVLVSVTERIQGFRIIEDRTERLETRLSPEARGKFEKQAQGYLDKIAKQLEREGLKVDTDVQFGSPSEGIIACSINNKCDIIIMASHGRSGISRWSHGSVADKVFRASNLPVLMVKAPGAVDNLK